MAITKERLQELIKQGATIWSDVWDEEVYLNNKCHLEPYHNNSIPTEPVNDYVLWVYEDDEHINKYFISQLEENVKGAKWALKYHATRTEELNLPMWEEFKNSKDKCIGFWSKTYDTYWLSLRYDKIRLSRSDDDYECEIVERTWETTEENYAKACDLCVKLFKEGV